MKSLGAILLIGGNRGQLKVGIGMIRAHGDDLQLSIADDGVGLNVRSDPRSTGMGQRIVTAMASKLEASVERDPNHTGTRIVLRFRRANAPVTKSSTAAAG